MAGIPDSRQRAPVQPDGTVSLPQLGTVQIAGLTSSEMQAKIETTLATKTLRQRTPDGREYLVLIRPGDVTATIAEYRPIYVNGDVLTPGQHPFRPLMTVRQAIALSGGYSTMRARPLSDPADLQHDYKAARADLAREQVHLSRLKAELNGNDELDQRGFEKLPLPGPALAELVRSEAELLKTNQTAFKQESASLLRGIKQADEQIATLTVQEQQEQRGVQADTEELDRVSKAYGSGNLPSPRVAEGRRALLLSSTRRLQTTVRLMEVKRLRDEFASRLDSLDSQRKIGLLRELKETNARLDDIGLRLETVAEKLAGEARAAIMPGDASRSEITIVRKSEQKLSRISADEDTDLEPGDVIEVTVRLDYMMGLAAQH